MLFFTLPWRGRILHILTASAPDSRLQDKAGIPTRVNHMLLPSCVTASALCDWEDEYIRDEYQLSVDANRGSMTFML